MQQVCWERGLLDEAQTYKVEDLRQLLSNCTDFRNEETQMQSIARSLGVQVIFSPKCHPEIAGEGLEYTWAFFKNQYRKIPLPEKKKQKKEDFIKMVKKFMSEEKEENVISTRKFARRARNYILAYYSLTTGTDYTSPIPQEKIEKMMKQFKTHRSALDFDKGFVKACLM